jgi:glucokinase
VAYCAGRGELAAITARAVGEAAEAGDSLAKEILATSGTYLGRGLALIIDIINPERIVIGSIYARCTRFLQPSMQAAIERDALPAAVRVCAVVPAALGETIGDHACLTVAVDGLQQAMEE